MTFINILSSFPITDDNILNKSLKKQSEIFDGHVATRILNIFKSLV